MAKERLLNHVLQLACISAGAQEDEKLRLCCSQSPSKSVPINERRWKSKLPRDLGEQLQAARYLEANEPSVTQTL